MSVEIWKGVFVSKHGNSYNTDVTANRQAGLVWIDQKEPGASSEDVDSIALGESEAIDIALCILKELVPGFIQNEVDLIRELARLEAAYEKLASDVRLLPKE
jgi:hypothetical protein